MKQKHVKTIECEINIVDSVPCQKPFNPKKNQQDMTYEKLISPPR